MAWICGSSHNYRKVFVLVLASAVILLQDAFILSMLLFALFIRFFGSGDHVNDRLLIGL